MQRAEMDWTMGVKTQVTSLLRGRVDHVHVSQIKLL